MLHYQKYQSPLGSMTLLGDETALKGVWFDGQQHYAAQYDLSQLQPGSTAVLAKTADWLTAYFAGERPDPAAILLKPEVTPFRQRVLQILTKIPYGAKWTYGDISEALQGNSDSKRQLARAVGGAVGHNPISILIPCHRVVGSDGRLVGYAGGIDRKIALLKLESSNLN